MPKRKQRNSLVENINRRKRAGTSRPKRRSTIAKTAYRDMQRWPRSRKRKAAKRTASRKTASRRRSR